MTNPSPGRGRPSRFDQPMREEYLRAVTHGMRLGDAADHVGIHRNIATRAARTEPAFAAALKTARALGKKTRDDAKEHGESRYKHQACRCPTCTADATAGRTRRRHAAQDDPAGQVYDLPAPASPPSFSLARAS